MRVQKTCKTYRNQRGDYEIELKKGESITITGYLGDALIIMPNVSNSIRVKSKTNTDKEEWCDETIKRDIEVE